MLGGSRAAVREESAATTDAGGGSQGADREVDDATRELVSQGGQRVEPVVGIRRRDEARLLEGGIRRHGTEVNTAQRPEPDSRRGCVTDHVVGQRPTDGRLNRPDADPRVVVHARQDFALTMERGQHVAAVVRDDELDDLGHRPQAVGDGGQQVVQPWPVMAEIATEPVELHLPSRLLGSEVGLVEHEQFGDVAGLDLAEHRVHGVDLRPGSAELASTTWTSRSASATTFQCS